MILFSYWVYTLRSGQSVLFYSSNCWLGPDSGNKLVLVMVARDLSQVHLKLLPQSDYWVIKASFLSSKWGAQELSPLASILNQFTLMDVYYLAAYLFIHSISFLKYNFIVFSYREIGIKKAGKKDRDRSGKEKGIDLLIANCAPTMWILIPRDEGTQRWKSFYLRMGLLHRLAEKS